MDELFPIFFYFFLFILASAALIFAVHYIFEKVVIISCILILQIIVSILVVSLCENYPCSTLFDVKTLVETVPIYIKSINFEHFINKIKG